jgi:hypothetical protein
MAGMTSSAAPAAFISRRTIAVIFSMLRQPSGR